MRASIPHVKGAQPTVEFVTRTGMSTMWVSAPEVPVTVIVYIPRGVRLEACNARVEVAAVPGSRCTGEGPPATPIVARGAVTVRETLPEKPPWLATIRVVVL